MDDASVMAELRSLGGLGLPVTVVGNRIIRGYNIEELTSALNLVPGEKTTLEPGAAETFDHLLIATLRCIKQIPHAKLDFKPPERDRTIRQLAHNIFNQLERNLESIDTGKFPEPSEDSRQEADKFRDVDEIVQYGERVRSRLRSWFANNNPGQLNKPVDAFFGKLTAGELLSRARGHTALHLRQLYDLLGRFGIKPEQPLSAEEFEQFGLPEKLW